jgi:two-component system sensor histidine kinase BaeS
MGHFRVRTIRNQLLLTLVAVIVVSGSIAYAANLVWARAAMDELVHQNDLDKARSLAAGLAKYYEQTSSWAGIADEVHRLRSGLRELHRYEDQDSREAGDEVPMAVADANGKVVYYGFTTPPGHPAARPERLDPAKAEAIQVAGQTVGYLLFKTMITRVYNPREARFLASINQTLGLTLGLQIVIAVALGVFLASRFVRPLTRLEGAVKRIAEGGSRDPVRVEGHNEIATLSANFNRMVVQLAAQEQSRRNLFADVAHELRTPVSILQANLEMMMEGVYPATRERLASLHEETQLLAKLIDDLRTISDLELNVVDGVHETVPLAKLVEEGCLNYQPLFRDKNMTLSTSVSAGNHDVVGDPFRLAQVLRNILENALRYACDGPGVEVTVARVGQALEWVRVTVADQGPGVDADVLTKLFDRFYRSEQSRNRERGGRGLGLAIVKQIVEAHGGRVGAENRSPQGLAVWLELPPA